MDIDTWQSITRVTSENNTAEPFPPLEEGEEEFVEN